MNTASKLAGMIGGAALVLAAFGCSAPQQQDDQDLAEGQSSRPGQEVQKGDGQQDKLSLPAFSAADGPAVKSLGWGEDGSLRLGFADGRWASVDTVGRKAAVSPVTDANVSILALSPAGKLAFVASEPPVIVRLRDQEPVMRLTSIKTLETAGFFADGKGLFVSEPTGKLHVWSQSEKTLDEVSTKDLKRFMARQTPDFTANLSPLKGQVLVTDSNALIMATESGKVLRWQPNNPGEIDAVVQLPASATSFGFDGRFVAATASDGSLRVISLFERSFVPWSMNASGQMVAASEALLDKFVVADGQTVGLRAFKDGAWDWQAKLPEGDLCGLTLSPDAKTLAVCVDSGVVLVEPSTGKTLAALRRAGEAIEWRE